MFDLIKSLNNYVAFDVVEEYMRKDLLKFLELSDKPFDNTTLPGHITVSGWVLDKNFERVLLIKHKKLGIWIHPGGHSDGNTDCLNEAIREVEEEVGVKPSILNEGKIFDIDTHLIPGDKKRGLGVHYHYDIRFLMQIEDESSIVRQKDEIDDLKFLKLDDAEELIKKTNARIQRMVEKSIKLEN